MPIIQRVAVLKDSTGTYEGEERTSDGKRHGKGKITFKDGNYYEGDFKDDLFDGRGTLIMKREGSKYVGSFSRGKRNGHGTEVFGDGSSYCGEFKDDKLCGQGKISKGIVEYEGEWKESKANGKGILRLGEEGRYEGDFRDGFFHGIGTFYFKDGSTYTGQWKKGKKDGHGKQTLSDSFFEGEFKDDLRHGTLRFNDGNIVRGTWEGSEYKGE